MSAAILDEYKNAGTGAAVGTFTCTSTAGYRQGAYGYIRGAAGSPASKMVRIVQVVSATVVKLVFVPDDVRDVRLNTGAVKYPNYGASDMSGYTAGSVLFQPRQVYDTDL